MKYSVTIRGRTAWLARQRSVGNAVVDLAHAGIQRQRGEVYCLRPGIFRQFPTDVAAATPTCAAFDQTAKRRSAISLFLSAGVCTVHTVNSAGLIKQLEKAGWVLRNVKGSHHVYSHPQRGHISVPHPRKDLGAGLVHKLLKQAGLK